MKTYRKQAKKAYAHLELALHDMFANAPVHIPYEVKLNGSLAYGTDIPTEKPDLDVFILTPFPVKSLQLAQIYFHKGIVKQGELLIWYLDSYLGFPVDMVFENPDHLKTQTVLHTDYFAKNLSELAKKYTIKLKKLAKKYNLYGAEVGGITGIACTVIGMKMAKEQERIGSNSGNAWFLYHYGFGRYAGTIVDPVLEGRILTANIPIYKRNLAYTRLVKFMEPKWIDAFTIPRILSGTDREYQHIAKAVKVARNMFRHDYKHWDLDVTYDLFVEKTLTNVKFLIEGSCVSKYNGRPDPPLEPVMQQIPNGAITDEIVDRLMKELKLEVIGKGEDITYWYIQRNPHPDMTPANWFLYTVKDLVDQ